MFDKDLSHRLRTCTVLIKEYQECQKIFLDNSNNYHYVKSARIRSYSGPQFPVLGLNTEGNGVSLRIQSEYGKAQTKITPNTDTFTQCTLPLKKSH